MQDAGYAGTSYADASFAGATYLLTVSERLRLTEQCISPDTGVIWS
jgi:hypothetical protein